MEEEKETIRCCCDCKTTKTPMWRGGPSGPKSLCNACGIRFMKQRRSELFGIHSYKAYKKINTSILLSHGCLSLKKRRSLKEEEQAALCLLLLSCNSVLA
ncbi:GATA transcription factor 23 [Hirschfeldia incana]|nr:GATA transcription factor 23 [Hirschfeldia incana]